MAKKSIAASDARGIIEHLREVAKVSRKDDVTNTFLFTKQQSGGKAEKGRATAVIENVMFYSRRNTLIEQLECPIEEICLAFIMIGGDNLVWTRPEDVGLLKHEKWSGRPQLLGIEL